MKKIFGISLLLSLVIISSCKKSDNNNPDEQTKYNFPAGWSTYKTPFAFSNITLDNSGNVWYSAGGTIEKRIDTVVTDYSVSTYLAANSTGINTLKFDNSNQLWIGATHSITDSNTVGLIMFDGTTFFPYSLSNSGLHNPNVYSITVDPLNIKWIGTKNSLVKYDGTTWTYYDSINSPLREFSPVLSAFGSVWIAGHNSLKKFDGTTFTNWDATNSTFPTVGIRLLDKDNLGNLWFIGYNSSANLWKFDGSTFTSFAIPPQSQPPFSTQYAALKIDAQNNVWLTGLGLTKFNGTTWINYDVPTFTPYGDIHTPSYGQTIPASFTSMVIKSDSTKWFTSYNFPFQSIMKFKE